jgi:choice-of-anchor B domain-containing protein
VTYRGPDQQYKGREICFNASENAVGIADVTDKKQPKTLSTVSYPNVSYAHQGWLSEDQHFFFLDDETDEEAGTTPKTRTLVFDVSKLTDPVLIKEYAGETAATDHNLYVLGSHAYEANYKAGLRIINVKDPKAPVEAGFFDTTPTVDNEPGYAGAWSDYPFFQSGAIGISSISEGLFMVRFTPPTAPSR